MPNKAKLTTRERSSSNVSSDNLNKGSELSFSEVDSNFINLRDQSIAISDGSTSTDIDAGETITFSGASVSGNTVTVPTGAGMTVVGDDSTGTLINGGETLKIAGGTNVTTAMSGDTLTITASGGGSASGGNLADLQVNGTTLSPVTTNADLNLTANGTGVVDVVNAKFSTANATIGSIDTTMNTIDGGSSSGPSRLLLRATGGTNAVSGRDKNAIHFESHSGNFLFQKTGGSTANITTEVGSSMALKVSALEGGQTNAGGFTIDGSNNAAITFNQKVDMNNFNMENVNQFDASHVTANRLTVSGVEGSVTFNDNKIATGQTNSNLELGANGSGTVIINGLSFPTSDGSANQVLQTDGSGTLSFATVSGGSGSTGDLSISAQTITGTTSNGDIIIAPQGTGDVLIKTEGNNGGVMRVGDGVAGIVGSTNGEDLSVGANGGTGSDPRIIFGGDSTGHIKIEPKGGVGGTGKISMLGTLTGDTTSEAGNVRIEGVQIGHDAKITTYSSNQDLEIDASGTGAVSILTQKVMMTNLPTSNPSVAGQLYNDSGTLKISAG